MSDLLYSVLNNPYLERIVGDVRTACDELNLDFFAVGALARNVWYTAHDMPARGTKDVDFALYLPNQDVYNQLREKLIDDLGYTSASHNAFCLNSPHGVPVDLLPFGEIEENGKVIVEGQGLVEVKLDGFVETYQHAVRKIQIEDDLLNVCSIPAVVLLKLIAFDDRPERRPNDPLDIDAVLRHYPHLETDLIWEKYNFLYKDDSDHELIGIEVVGHEIAKIIHQNESLCTRVLDILERAMSGTSNLAKQMVSPEIKETVERKIERLATLRRGVVDGLKALQK
jgi:predicted nucleotidyltransferase